jgi:hypothetical protein
MMERFCNSLSPKEDREVFQNMLNNCNKYAAAINAKSQPLPAETIDYGFVAFTI